MNIAILEDNPAILDYLSTALQMNGHSVQTFTQGVDLLQALFQSGLVPSPLPFDLILVYLLLPGDISGLQALQSIRKSISYERLPVIIVSASGQKELDNAQAELPHTPVIRKPFKIMDLLKMIDSVKV